MSCILASLLAANLACDGGGSAQPSIGDDPLGPARFVDPMIGTRGAGNTIPGPSLPHGMVKLSPDTLDGFGTLEGYEHHNERIEGFSHTHLEGPGGSFYGYGQILLLPTVGDRGLREADYAQPYTHDDEVAEPGYYAVTLTEDRIRVELTATHRAGVHRYTFPADAPAAPRVIVDVSHSRGFARDGWVEIVGDDRIRGHGSYLSHPLVAAATILDAGTTSVSPIYFDAVFSRPFRAVGTWSGDDSVADRRRVEGDDIGAWVDPAVGDDGSVTVKVGISVIDADQARANREAEVPGWSFERTRRAARGAWNELLSRVRVEGGSEADRTRFYTALYHSMLAPVDFSEDGRFWSGADGFGAVFSRDDFRFHADDWCLWDTYRTTHPLATLVEPERSADVVQSYVHLYEQGGWIPKCTWRATGYSRVMIGNHSACMTLDALRKGLDGFDVTRAYEGLRKSAVEDNRNLLRNGACGYMNLGTPAELEPLGYVPLECDFTQAASMTLEHAYDDWCMGELARELGHPEDAARFAARGRNYRNLWDPEVGFMRPRWRSGEWFAPFAPDDPTGFTEADSWKYTWFVPHDVAGLIALMGGPGPFVEKLDRLFDEGHYDPTNQPDFHAAYLYSYAGRPDRTQERVAALRESAFGTGPGGLPGNDDAGSTSSWFVLSALGLYPVTPGEPAYVLAGPLFERVSIEVPTASGGGRAFVIDAPGAGAATPYIQEAWLDGVPLDRPWLRHEEIARGGHLELRMGSAPSVWGASPDRAPPSPASARALLN